MLLNGGELDGQRLLKPETIAEMTKNQIGDYSLVIDVHGDKFGYGFGVLTPAGKAAGAASAAIPGAASFTRTSWSIPKQQLIAIFATQIYPLRPSHAARRIPAGGLCGAEAVIRLIA